MSERRSRWGEPFATAAIVVVLAAVPASCRAQVRDTTTPSVQAAYIPPYPADTTPADVWRNTDPSGTMARDVMWVAFSMDAMKLLYSRRIDCMPVLEDDHLVCGWRSSDRSPCPCHDTQPGEWNAYDSGGRECLGTA